MTKKDLKRTHIGFNSDAATKHKLRVMAAQRDMSMTKLVEFFIQQGLKNGKATT